MGSTEMLALQKLPVGHVVHPLAPALLYCPAEHADADVDPATHAVPATQVVHALAPAALNEPLPHITCVPALHAYPCRQGTQPETDEVPAGLYRVDGHAVQIEDPATLYHPAAHVPVQFATDSPVVLPHSPALQLEQTATAAVLY